LGSANKLDWLLFLGILTVVLGSDLPYVFITKEKLDMMEYDQCKGEKGERKR